MKDEEESFIWRLSHSSLDAFRDVWAVWLTLTVLTTLPYVIAALRTPNGFAFTGVLTAYDDTFTYFAWMRQSSDGHLLMCDMFTSEAQSCEFFLPLWNILGFVARATGLPMALTFHVARVLAGLLLLIVARAVVASVMKTRGEVRYALWLYAMSGGFGWLVYGLRNRIDLFSASVTSGSADLNMPEAIAFRSVFAQVHFAVGAALIFASIKCVFSALIDKKPSRALTAGILASILAVVHPYLVVVVCAVVGASLLMWPWLSNEPGTRASNYGFLMRIAAMFAVTTIPGAAYLVYLNRSNAVLREWLRITDTLSPGVWEYVLGFGIIGLLSIFGFRLMWRSGGESGRLLLVWALVQATLLYAPLSFQRRLVEGLQLPLSVAASVALLWLAHRFFKGARSRHYGRLFLASVIVVASLTNVGLVIGQIVVPGGVSSSVDSRRYLSADLVAAFEWLRMSSDRDTVLFSSYLTGNVAPSMTGLRVFLGHYGQTIRSDEKGAQVTAFYSGTVTDDASRQLLREHRVRYVIYGPFERAISDSFKPPGWFKLVYRAGEVEVFEVSQDVSSALQ